MLATKGTLTDTCYYLHVQQLPFTWRQPNLILQQKSLVKKLTLGECLSSTLPVWSVTIHVNTFELSITGIQSQKLFVKSCIQNLWLRLKTINYEICFPYPQIKQVQKQLLPSLNLFAFVCHGLFGACSKLAKSIVCSQNLGHGSFFGSTDQQKNKFYIYQEFWGVVAYEL